jgi:hypothetical protein
MARFVGGSQNASTLSVKDWSWSGMAFEQGYSREEK